MPNHPTTSTPAIPADIEARIASYARPTSLDADTARQLLPGLKDLVRAVGPRTREDAKVLLTVGCTLLADALAELPSRPPLAETDVRDLVTDRTVAAWSHRPMAEAMAPASLAAYLRHMRRLVRARNGLPPRAPQVTSKPERTPISHDTITALIELLADDPAARKVLLEAVTLGPRRDGIAGAGKQSSNLTLRWSSECAALGSVVIDGQARQRVQRMAARAGFRVDRHELTLRWATDVLDTAPTGHDALVALASRRLIEAAAPHAQVASDADIKAVLRG